MNKLNWQVFWEKCNIPRHPSSNEPSEEFWGKAKEFLKTSGISKSSWHVPACLLTSPKPFPQHTSSSSELLTGQQFFSSLLYYLLHEIWERYPPFQMSKAKKKFKSNNAYAMCKQREMSRLKKWLFFQQSTKKKFTFRAPEKLNNSKWTSREKKKETNGFAL